MPNVRLDSISFTASVEYSEIAVEQARERRPIKMRTRNGDVC